MRFLTPLVVVLALILFPLSYGCAQVGIGTATPNAKAVLELKSPGNNQGFLVPRLTTAERTTITGLSASESGLLVFDTGTNKFYYWNGSAWVVIDDSVGTDSQTLTFTPGTSTLAISGGNSVSVIATGTAGGDLNGSYPNPTIDGLQGRPVASTLPSSGEVLKWNGSSWAPATDGSTLTSVLGTGNNAGAQAGVNFSAISVNRADTPGALNVNGSHYTAFTTLGTVTSYTVAADDYLIVGTSSPSVQTTATLPDASTCVGRILIFRGRSVGAATIAGLRVQPATGDAIDGNTAATAFLTPMLSNPISITIVAISANEWITISKSIF